MTIQKIEFDLSGEDYAFNFNWLAQYIEQGLEILSYTHIGPGGGNPCFVAEGSPEVVKALLLNLEDGTWEEDYEELLDLHLID